jgi:hypothetical protein
MEKLIGFGIVGLVLYTMLSHGFTPSPSLTALNTVTQGKGSFKLLGTPNDATGILEVSDKKSKSVLATYYFDDRWILHEPPEQTKSGTLEAVYRPVTTGLRLQADLGAFAGFSTQGPVAGFRISPCRIFENISPDILLGTQVLGAGVSIYPPRGYGQAWVRHVGAGVGLATDMRGSTGPLAYLSLSTTF